MTIHEVFPLVPSCFTATFGFVVGVWLRSKFESQAHAQTQAQTNRNPAIPDPAAGLVLMAHAAYDLGRSDHAEGRPPRSRAEVLLASTIEGLRGGPGRSGSSGKDRPGKSGPSSPLGGLPSPDVSPATIRAATTFAKTCPATVSGDGGHRMLYSIARALLWGFDLPMSAAWPILRGYGQRCLPPWDDAEVWRKLEDAAAAPACQEFPRGYLLLDPEKVSV